MPRASALFAKSSLALSISPETVSANSLNAFFTLLAEFVPEDSKVENAELNLCSLSSKTVNCSFAVSPTVVPQSLVCCSSLLAFSVTLLRATIVPASPAVPNAAHPTGPIPANIGVSPPMLPAKPVPPAPIAELATVASVAIPLRASSPAPLAPILASIPVVPDTILVKPLRALAVGAMAAAAKPIFIIICCVLGSNFSNEPAKLSTSFTIGTIEGRSFSPKLIDKVSRVAFARLNAFLSELFI